jgi:FKBP-type peptidyl-prolyl cis-trans isomerase 2
MTLRPLLIAACAVALAAGCLGVPAGTAGAGDSVTIRYTAYELGNSTALPGRENRTATFSVGEGDSGLGLGLEKAVRGHREGDSFAVSEQGDPSLDYSGLVEVNRTLAPIPANQTAPRADFTNYVGEPAVGQEFPAYGIYTGVVTNVTNDTVAFTVLARDGQQAPVASVGAILVTHVTPDALLRRLDPVNGSTFVIQPPSPFQPSTPLGLEPGSYRVLGATADKLQYARSSSSAADLVGKALRFEVTVLQVTSVEAPVPTGGNFGVRHSPQVQGDPSSVLGGPLPTPTA